MIRKRAQTPSPNTSAETNTETRPEDAEFFLPNFCAIQPVLLLVLFSQLLAVTFVLVREPLTPFPWDALTLISVFILWVSLITASLWCGLREFMMHWPEQVSACICFVILIVVTCFFSLMGQWLIPLQDFDWSSFTPSWSDVIQHTLIGAIIGGLMLRYFYLAGQLEKKRQSELLHRIQALQSRIHPHFLFNSMNIIASLIGSDPKTAETVVEDLAEVFRASLNEVQSQVPLSQEIELCRRYLNIEQMRLGKRLDIIWDLPKVIHADAQIPMLTIQPILENAIYHGIQHIPEGGTITVSIRLKNNRVNIKVRNPMLAKPPRHDHGNKLAIGNIKNRLAALYGQSAILKHQLEASWYCVEIQYDLAS